MQFKYIITTTIILALLYLCSVLFASRLKDDEELLFLPTYASVKTSSVIANIHAWVFELEEDSIIRKMIINDIEHKVMKLEKNQIDSKHFREKLRYFLVDNQRGKEITISLNFKKYQLQTTQPNGHSLTQITLENIDKNKQQAVLFFAVPEKDDKRSFNGLIQFIPERGISVISDIDDTIKDSNVLDKKALLKNTFLRPYKPVNDMPSLYSNWKKKGAAFHYVSGSPWQLYVPISDFLKKYGYPVGSVHLKYFRIKDRSFINFISGKQKEYKIDLIKQIINDFPKRKFVLIGDSGEKDPEVYADICKLYPNNILKVCIRDMGNIASDSQRYKETVSIIGADKFVLFKSGEDLRGLKI